MTEEEEEEEEEEELVDLTVRHMQARIERRDELRKRFDELVFKRRCWAATLGNHAFTLGADVAHVRHQLRVCKGKALPEELEDARRRNHHCVVTMNEHIGKAMDMGLEAFAHDYCKFYENEKKMRCEGDENGVPQGPIVSK
jgi:flagellar biosynthesis regulator FlaF